jgi:glucokinase
MRVLAIDIGGTKSALALCELKDGIVASVSGLKSFVSREFNDLSDMVHRWQTEHPELHYQAIGAGVAGPVVNQTVTLTNLGWSIQASKIGGQFAVPCKICNDMESHGWGVLGLTTREIRTLNQGQPSPGPKALIAAGTGLGEAIIAWDGFQYTPMPGEGGHASFSATNDLEDALSHFLRQRTGGHVSWERILGGLDGFRNLAIFMLGRGYHAKPLWMNNLGHGNLDWGPALIDAALSGEPLASDTLAFYCELYGKEAANLALKCLTRGGVYIGGGIAPRITPWMERHFMRGFTDKGRFSGLLASIPVHIIDDPLNGLKGAALQFTRHSRGPNIDR